VHPKKELSGRSGSVWGIDGAFLAAAHSEDAVAPMSRSECSMPDPVELQQVLLDLWPTDRKTALMVTHDVESAVPVGSAS